MVGSLLGCRPLGRPKLTRNIKNNVENKQWCFKARDRSNWPRIAAGCGVISAEFPSHATIVFLLFPKFSTIRVYIQRP